MPVTKPNLRPLTKSEAWMFDKVEAAAARKGAEDRAKAIRRYATRLAEKRRIMRDDALHLMRAYASRA